MASDLFGPPAPAGTVENRGVGRPPGAKNKANRDLAKLIAHKYQGRSPGEELAAIAMPAVEELMEMYCIEDREQALAVKMRALKELLPYCHQKQPQVVDVQGERPVLVQFTMPDGQPMGQMQLGAGQPGQPVIDMRPQDLRRQPDPEPAAQEKEQQKQPLNDPRLHKSDEGKSDNDS